MKASRRQPWERRAGCENTQKTVKSFSWVRGGGEGEGGQCGQSVPLGLPAGNSYISSVTDTIHPPGMKDLKQLGLTRQRFKWEINKENKSQDIK